MDLFYAVLDLPVGKALVAATGKGITRLVLRGGTPARFAGELEAEYGVKPVRSDAPFELAGKELAAYFEGRLRRFAVSLDVHGTKFQQTVWKALMKVPYGRVTTYGGLADIIGRRGAARAVGGALHANRVPIIIPCHRVVASAGGLGGYGSGVDIKKRLLEIEGVQPPYRAQ